jgi:hypothetical protein
LRTKLLFSFVLLTTCLTSATLLVLRREAQGQVQHQIEQDTRNAILTFQTVQRQQQSALSRKADLLASLAFMRDGDATAITDASESVAMGRLQSVCAGRERRQHRGVAHDEFVAIDRGGATLLWRSVRRGETASWWFTGWSLYQVVCNLSMKSPPQRKTLRAQWRLDA